jgi:hypothetical protein
MFHNLEARGRNWHK